MPKPSPIIKTQPKTNNPDPILHAIVIRLQKLQPNILHHMPNPTQPNPTPQLHLPGPPQIPTLKPTILPILHPAPTLTNITR